VIVSRSAIFASAFYLDHVRIPIIPANEEEMQKWQEGMTRSNIL